MPAKEILRSSQLREGASHLFSFSKEGKATAGFLIRFRGQVHAYENVCRHIPVSLDYDDGRFFSPDGRHLICQTHGALYDPANGKCVRGPCPGLSLFPIPVEEKDGGIWLLNAD